MTLPIRSARNQARVPANLARANNAVLPGDGTVPDWIELLPPGVNVQGADGRAWINDQPQEIVAEFNRAGRPLPLDEEHATDKAAPRGLPAPAAGWIEELAVRDGGAIWGRVNWTPPGAELVKNRQYRFISPTFFYEVASARVLRMVSAALTNSPNLPIAALNRRQSPSEPFAMNEALLAALGLSKTATEAEAIQAVNKLKGDLATANNRAETPSLEKFVPRADYAGMEQRAVKAENSLKERDAKALDGEIEQEIKSALEAKKITPATAEYHKAQCRQEGGLARFKEFVKSAPVVAADSGMDRQDPAKGASAGLSPEQLAVCRNMNLKPEDFKAALA